MHHLNKCQQNIDSDENPTSRALNERINQLVEKLSEIICSVGVKLVAPGIILPKVIFSYFIYFTTDAGSAAFGLPLPMW